MMGYGGMGGGGRGWGGAGWSGPGWGGMFGGSALFILALLVILALVYFYRRANHGRNRLFTKASQGRHDSHPTAHPSYRAGQAAGTGPEEEAMSALAARLAAGEITPEDYRDRVTTLRTVRDQGVDPTAGMPYLGPDDAAQPNGRAA